MKRLKEVEVDIEDLELPEDEFVKKYGGFLIQGILDSEKKKIKATIAVGPWIVKDYLVKIDVWNCQPKLLIVKNGEVVKRGEDLLREHPELKEKLEKMIRDSVPSISRSGVYPPGGPLKKLLEEIL